MPDSLSTQDLTEMLYTDLKKLMWAMVWDIANSERWQLDPEELHAELSAELVHIVDEYTDKSYSELKAIAIVSMRNRLRDVKKQVYKTHRRAELYTISLDDVVDLNISTELVWFDLNHLLSSLSDDAKKLVFEVLYPSENTLRQLDLAVARKSFVSRLTDSWTITVNKLIMRRALGWDVDKVEAVWNEVVTVLSTI